MYTNIDTFLHTYVRRRQRRHTHTHTHARTQTGTHTPTDRHKTADDVCYFVRADYFANKNGKENRHKTKIVVERYFVILLNENLCN